MINCVYFLIMKNLNKEKELLDKRLRSVIEGLRSCMRTSGMMCIDTRTLIVGNRADAEDTTSQTFLEFFKKIHTFVWKSISMKNWLFTTARNIGLKTLRGSMITSFDDSQVPDMVEISFVDEVIAKDLLQKVVEQIQQLKHPDRELITLRLWEGMQFNEIAEIQGEKTDTVKRRFYRGIEKLRRSLESNSVRNVFPLPLVFTAIAHTRHCQEFTPSDTFSNKTFQEISRQSNTMLNLTTLKTFLTSNLGIALIAGLVVITGAGIGFWVYSSNNNKEPDDIQSNTNTSSSPTLTNRTPAPTKDSSPAPTQQVLPTSPETTQIPTPSPQPDYQVFKDNYITFNYPQGWTAKVVSGNVKAPLGTPYTGVSSVELSSNDSNERIEVEVVPNLGDPIGYSFDQAKPNILLEKIVVSGQVNTLTVKGEAQLVKLQESNKAILTCTVSTGSAFILLGKLSGTQFTSSPYGNPGTFGFGNVNIAGEKNGDLPESSLQILGIYYSATNADEFTKHLVEFLNSVERLG